MPDRRSYEEGRCHDCGGPLDPFHTVRIHEGPEPWAPVSLVCEECAEENAEAGGAIRTMDRGN